MSRIYNFCPNCRNKLVLNEKQAPYCWRCNWTFYTHPVIGCNVIIENQLGEILLSERAYDPGAGSLDLPGGFVEQRENVEQALRREIKEELNVTIPLKKLSYFTSHPDLYLYKNINKNILTLTYIFKINSSITKLVSGDDSKNIFFFKPEAIPYAKIKFNCIILALHEYISRFYK
jgi:ADP-ribose pyrophosphatase YjhB (NUDIX family)